jgi:hypothetical protein
MHVVIFQFQNSFQFIYDLFFSVKLHFQFTVLSNHFSFDIITDKIVIRFVVNIICNVKCQNRGFY